MQSLSFHSPHSQKHAHTHAHSGDTPPVPLSFAALASLQSVCVCAVCLCVDGAKRQLIPWVLCAIVRPGNAGLSTCFLNSRIYKLYSLNGGLCWSGNDNDVIVVMPLKILKTSYTLYLWVLSPGGKQQDAKIKRDASFYDQYIYCKSKNKNLDLLTKTCYARENTQKICIKLWYTKNNPWRKRSLE